MKRALQALVVGIVFLGIMGIILYKVFYTASPSPKQESDGAASFNTITESLKSVDTSSPQNAAYVCYTWYLQYLSSQVVSEDTIRTNPTIARCFTTNFINSWSSNLGTPGYLDPVLISADLGQSWLSASIQASQISAIHAASVVNVILGSGNADARTLTVHLTNVNGDWKIDSVENPE